MLRKPLPSWLAFLPHLFRSFWTFFPGIFFILLTLVAFWLLGPGGDMLTAYVEPKLHPDPTERVFRLVFYVAIALWVYVTWYSSRIIADIKGKEQKIILVHGVDAGISSGFLEGIPRLAGHACFLVIELALWPILIFPGAKYIRLIAFAVLFVGLVAFYFLEKWALKRADRKVDARGREVTPFLWAFRVVGALTAIAIAVSIIFITGYMWLNLTLALFAIFLLHALYFVYINLRRVRLRRLSEQQPPADVKYGWLSKVMYFFCITVEEKSWFGWFLVFMGIGLVIEIFGFSFIWFAQHISPFPVVLLGFSMLLAAANLVAALSIRYRLNFHLVITLLAVTLLGRHENHRVQPMDCPSAPIGIDRPTLETYLRTWLNTHVQPDSNQTYDVYFVMSNGGASRSGYWTATVLGAIEDASIAGGDVTARFSDHLFCLSGASGGAVGVTAFFAALRNKHLSNGYCAAEDSFFHNDFFSFTAARLLGPDYFHYIIPFNIYPDRARALEQSLEASASPAVPMADAFESFQAVDHGKAVLPLLFINTTRMNDGTPGVVSNLKISGRCFNGRIDVDSLLDANNLSVSLSTAAILGSRFPYISPAGRIGNEYFVDGGYFDNSGAGIVQELIQGIQDIAAANKNDTRLLVQIHRLHYHVIHIINSGGDDAPQKGVTPFVNDLFAPVITVAGTYNLQTTVNDSRLDNCLKELNITKPGTTESTEISLYLQKGDSGYNACHPEPPYPMNWFMSETLKGRMDQRRKNNSQLQQLMAQFHK